MLGLPLPLFIGFLVGGIFVIVMTLKDIYDNCIRKSTKSRKQCTKEISIISIGTSIIAIVVLYAVLAFVNWLFYKTIGI